MSISQRTQCRHYYMAPGRLLSRRSGRATFGRGEVSVRLHTGSCLVVVHAGGKCFAVVGTSKWCAACSTVMQYGGTLSAQPGNAFAPWRYRLQRYPEHQVCWQAGNRRTGHEAAKKELGKTSSGFFLSHAFLYPVNPFVGCPFL